MRLSRYERELNDLTAKAALKLYNRRAEWPSRDALRQAQKQVKFQCWLSLEEAATLDALRAKYGVTRYGLVRLALLALIEVAGPDMRSEIPDNTKRRFIKLTYKNG